MIHSTGITEANMQKFPAHETQKEIWISSKMGHDASCAYNQAIQIGISGSCSVPSLQRAVETVVALHDVFDTVFSSDGRWMILRENGGAEVAVIDHSMLTMENRAAWLLQYYTREATTEFDLEHGPLWRATIVVLSQSELRLFFTAHHIICDGWSLSVIIDSIISAYSSYLKNQDPDLPIAPSFTEYLLERQHFSGTAAAKEQLAYWQNKFKGPVPQLELPTDKPRPRLRTYRAGSISREIPLPLFAEVKKVSVALQCNPFTFFLGAYAVLLQKLSGNTEVVIGISVSGQSFQDKKDLVGHCVSMLPVCCTVDVTASVATFMGNLQDTLYDDFDNYTVTFGELLKVLEVKRDPGRIPLIATCLTYVKMKSPKELSFEGFSACNSISERAFETFEMEGAIIESGNNHHLLWHFNTDLFHAETMERWIDGYLTILSHAAGSPESTLSSLYILPDRVKSDMSSPLSSEREVATTSTVQNVQNVARSTAAGNFGSVHELESELVKVWQEVLALEAVGRQDNFFAIGGDSQLCVAVQKTILEKLRYAISMTSLFQYPTIEKLAAFMHSGQKDVKIDGEIEQRILMKRQALNSRRDAHNKRKNG